MQPAVCTKDVGTNVPKTSTLTTRRDDRINDREGGGGANTVEQEAVVCVESIMATEEASGGCSAHGFSGEVGGGKKNVGAT